MVSLYPPSLPQPIHNPAGYMHKIVIPPPSRSFSLPAPACLIRRFPAGKRRKRRTFHACHALRRPKRDIFSPSEPESCAATYMSHAFLCMLQGAWYSARRKAAKTLSIRAGQSTFQRRRGRRRLLPGAWAFFPRSVASPQTGPRRGRTNPTEAATAREALPHPPVSIKKGAHGKDIPCARKGLPEWIIPRKRW